MEDLVIYTDGGARGNPGPAGIGIVFFNKENKVIKEFCKYIGESTNNQAEYTALYTALRKASELGYKNIHIFLDSELVVRQMLGIYKVKNNKLKELYNKIKELEKNFKNIEYHHIPREKNKYADSLVNKAIDRYFSSN